LKKILKFTGITLVLILIAIYVSNRLVKHTAKTKLYSTTNTIPFNKVGLLLGTGKNLSNGNLNLYYKYRIDATLELFNAGKINYILISGDNSRTTYDEPTEMKNDLILKGIPEDKIILDYAGFRTLDSVVRSQIIFGLEHVTVISQEFHNERAIFIAKNKGMQAIGFNAKSVSARYGFKTQLREKLARVKMMLDLVFGKKPKFLGKKIEIG
jgi:SanA protein